MDRARKFAYATLVVSVAVVAHIIPAASQTRDQNWARCEDNNPDLSIGGCTAVIQAGGETDENLASAFFNRGLAYRRQGQNDLAIANYNEAIRLKPDDADAFVNRGYAYIGKGQYALAIADDNEAIRLKPDNADAFANRGSVYFGKGQYDLAIMDYDKALSIRPDAIDFFNRGNAYCGKSQYDLANADYNEAIRLKPDFADAFYNRGGAKQKLGDVAGGAADIAQAKALGYTP